MFAPRWYIQPEKWSLGAESFEDTHTGRAGYRGKEMEAMKQRALHLQHELQGLYISRQLKTYMHIAFATGWAQTFRVSIGSQLNLIKAKGAIITLMTPGAS